MKRSFSVLAFTALAVVLPARAASYSVDFTGIVSQTQGPTGEAVGNAVTGHFDLDSVTSSFLDFTIAGQSIAAGYQSSVSIGPNNRDAFYSAQITAVPRSPSIGSTFWLDLSSLTSWPQTDSAYTLLADTNQLTTNLETINNSRSGFPSDFFYYTANFDGTNAVGLSGNLTSINVTATPEPASLALIVPSLFALGLFIRRCA